MLRDAIVVVLPPTVQRLKPRTDESGASLACVTKQLQIHLRQTGADQLINRNAKPRGASRCRTSAPPTPQYLSRRTGAAREWADFCLLIGPAGLACVLPFLHRASASPLAPRFQVPARTFPRFHFPLVPVPPFQVPACHVND